MAVLVVYDVGHALTNRRVRGVSKRSRHGQPLRRQEAIDGVVYVWRQSRRAARTGFLVTGTSVRSVSPSRLVRSLA